MMYSYLRMQRTAGGIRCCLTLNRSIPRVKRAPTLYHVLHNKNNCCSALGVRPITATLNGPFSTTNAAKPTINWATHDLSNYWQHVRFAATRG